MPFKSEAQRRLLFAKHPQVAREFAEKTQKGKKLPERRSMVEGVKKKLKGRKSVY